MKTGVVDYKAGNLRSIQNLLQFLKADIIISDKRFPGSGRFLYCTQM